MFVSSGKVEEMFKIDNVLPTLFILDQTISILFSFKGEAQVLQFKGDNFDSYQI